MVYLRDDVYFEPLVHKWYAWPYLVPPVCAAMNITGRSVRLMKSFLSNHRLHIAASKDPSLVGGDFLNCDESQLNAITRLVSDIETNYSDYFDVRAAVTQLNQLLKEQAGLSLEHLYEQVPDVLRGFVELVYDMNHHASFRLIEGLLYQSSLYKRQAQSISLGLLSRVRDRPFVLSSPRLPDANHLHIEVPWTADLVDRISAARDAPVDLPHLEALLQGRQMEGGLSFSDLFTAEPPKYSCPPLGSNLLRIRFLGHAGILLETPDLRILVDPVIASRDEKHGADVVSFGELPKIIDYICVTHTHMDHVCLETLLQLRHKTRQVLVPRNGAGTIADPSIKLMLHQLGFAVREFEDMEEIQCPGGKIQAIPFLGEHADLNVRSKTAWYFELAGKKLLAGADSSNLDPRMYEHIHKSTGNLDFLFIGMECVGAPMSWLYGALFTDPIPRQVNESRRFNGSDFLSARRLVDIFKPTQVGIYAMGMEPWYRYFMGMEYTPDAKQVVESNKLQEYCRERGISSELLYAKQTWIF
jgi:L-ascorbate metabolism protein UlaG (beta-lactamase superfamily)